MANHVTQIADGVILMALEGDQDAHNFGAVVAEAERLMADTVAAKKPVNILVDLSRVGRLDLAVRQLAASNLRNWPFNRVAVFGATTYLRHLANLVILATGSKGAKVVGTEAEAREWLK